MMHEKQIEKAFITAVKRRGGLALIPRAKLAFVELKAPGKLMRPFTNKAKKAVGSIRIFGVLRR